MSTTEQSTQLVKVTIDGREVEVPKGLGIVEAAAHAGVEIPVFCYEPRLGPPVGACRMCLVEVEGMGKLQTGCTMTATDGLVVKTAQTSKKAADGQNSTLEFILLNHPLDCPVCDKGGECPLQDLTFRYGPGATRMFFAKRTLEKPIPISPTIALDRERCILCYRCTRFSENVSEDMQLVAENRGAESVIATFEDEPYRAAFSGNVIELCPVGALTSTQYRFEARPWEIDDVPSVCGLCPVGCNISGTTREGKVKRIQSRNHPEIDQGWLCDKGRFAFSHLYADDRMTTPLRRVPRAGLEEIGFEAAIDEFEGLLREARGATLVAFSGSETNELAYALATLVKQGADSNAAVLPEQSSEALDAYRIPISAIGKAEVIVVVGDDPVVERAPLVDLWIKHARRNGAAVHVLAPIGTAPRKPGDAAAACRELAEKTHPLNKALRAAERAVLIWSGPGGAGGAHLAALAAALGLDKKAGSGALYLPATPNGRGVDEAWAAVEGGQKPALSDEIGLLIVSGDEAAADPRLRELAERARATVVIGMFHGLAAGWADLIIPGTSYLERDGSMQNLEGRVQRLRPTVGAPVPSEHEWLSDLAGRFGLELAASPALLHPQLFAGRSLGSLGESAPLPERGARVAVEPPEPVKEKAARGGPLKLLPYRGLFSGPAVERVPELTFQRPLPEVEISAEDADRRSISQGDEVVVRSNGTSVSLRARVNKHLHPGVVRVAEEFVGELAAGVEVVKS